MLDFEVLPYSLGFQPYINWGLTSLPPTFMQILQEQQALLLEDSPAYLAALSQDDPASCLNTAADAHDRELTHRQNISSTALVAKTPEDAQSTSMHYSR